MKKIDILEKNFSKAEMFLLKMLPAIEKPENDGTFGFGLNDLQSTSNVDTGTIDALKSQHKKSLIGIKDFYSKCDQKLEKITKKNADAEKELKDYKTAFKMQQY